MNVNDVYDTKVQKVGHYVPIRVNPTTLINPMTHPIISKDPVDQGMGRVVSIGSGKRNERTVQVVVLGFCSCFPQCKLTGSCCVWYERVIYYKSSESLTFQQTFRREFR